ncbi:hypothetical protein DICVIV_07723 [Dictyocaulus viviparus]|uniref:Uncharacterized protein n=1 Tax=Dictyocaulus viviparus TaxID=29172 RepID=A0A0D8XNK8_DICVI|nr:hypothetical protein DICVIV_07723 [Dictyocaulus viviparus]
MKYLGAYLLATMGGNSSPSAKDILAILGNSSARIGRYYKMYNSILCLLSYTTFNVRSGFVNV